MYGFSVTVSRRRVSAKATSSAVSAFDKQLGKPLMIELVGDGHFAVNVSRHLNGLVRLAEDAVEHLFGSGHVALFRLRHKRLGNPHDVLFCYRLRQSEAELVHLLAERVALTASVPLGEL